MRALLDKTLGRLPALALALFAVDDDLVELLVQFYELVKRKKRNPFWRLEGEVQLSGGVWVFLLQREALEELVEINL